MADRVEIAGDDVVKGLRRVLVVEDDEFVLRAQERVLGEDARLEVTGVQTFRAAERVVRERAFDVALVDLHLSPGWGINLVGPLLRRNPDCHVAILTGLPDLASCRDAVMAGAIDYAAKGGQGIEYRRAVLAFALGERLTLSDGPASGAPASLAHWSRLYIQGVVNQCGGNLTQAAATLGISRGTLYRRLQEPLPLD